MQKGINLPAGQRDATDSFYRRTARGGKVMQGILCELQKPGGKIMRATVTTYKGSRPFLDLREWYCDGAGEWKAGKGCTLPLDRIADLHCALGQWLADSATTD